MSKKPPLRATSILLRSAFVLSILQASNTCLLGQNTNENTPPQARAAQQATRDSTNKTVDSLRDEALIQQSSQLQELETRRIIDSARQSELQQQLKSLQSS